MDYDSYRAAKSPLTVLDHELEKISYSCHWGNKFAKKKFTIFLIIQ